MTDLRSGQQYPRGIGIATIYPDHDDETYSEAGYVWNPEKEKWDPLPGLNDQNKGLKGVGARNYVEHPTFEMLSKAWDLKDGKGPRWWRPDIHTPYKQYPRYPENGHAPDCSAMTSRYSNCCDCPASYHPAELLEYVRNGGILEAFNVHFEWQVWNFHCVPKLGWPPLSMAQCRCAMAKSKASAYPGALAEVGRVLKLTEQKDAAGDALIKKLTVPQKPTKANPYLRWTPFNAPEDFKRFYEYNIQDIRTEAEASFKIPDLTDRELRIWQTDFRINMRGMRIDTHTVYCAIAIIEQCEQRGDTEIRQLTNNAVDSYSEGKKIITWAQTQGVTLYSLKESELYEYLKRTDYPPKVLRVLQLRATLSYGSCKKYYAIRAQTAADGRIYDLYDYYGAHTGLWNGRGAQPANLYKGSFRKPEQVQRAIAAIRTRCLEMVEYEFPDMDALEVVASCLRSMIIASEGNKLISADYSSIQAIGTSCIADEKWRIDAFRTHGNAYYAMACKLTGKTMEFYMEYRKRMGEHHPDRQLGKLAMLSGDFGAWISGWKRFGAEKYLGDDANIKKTILSARNAQPNVVHTWGGQTIDKFTRGERQHLFGLEGAVVSAILEPGTCFSSKPGARMAVLFQIREDTLYCRPPSGGTIHYHAPRLKPSTRDHANRWEYEISYEGFNTNLQKGPYGWIRMDLYGGVLMQNVDSHMCREIQADAVCALEDNGYDVVMHTHDEQVTDVPKGHTIQRYREIVKGAQPKWAICEDGQPWPISIPDPWEQDRFGKWEFD